jgi:hypothetical protein
MGTDLSSAELGFFNSELQKLPTYVMLRDAFTFMAPGCEVRVHKTTVSFRAPRPFVYISFPFRKSDKDWTESSLMISFTLDAPSAHPAVIQSTFIRPAQYTIHALVSGPGGLDPALAALVECSLQYRNKQGGTP